MQHRVIEGSTGGGGPTKRRRCVFVCVPAGQQRGPAVWIPRQPLVTLPSDHLGPVLRLISTHTRAVHRWELLVTVVMAGVGRAADASFSPFVSFCQPILSSSLSSFLEFLHLVLLHQSCPYNKHNLNCIFFNSPLMHVVSAQAAWFIGNKKVYLWQTQQKPQMTATQTSPQPEEPVNNSSDFPCVLFFN